MDHTLTWSAGGFGSLRSSSHDDADSSDGSGTTTNAGSDGESSPARSAKSKESTDYKTCRYLAASYQPPNAGKEVASHVISEKFLRSLMRRFPYGKIWNFDSYGSLSSDDLSDSTAASSDAGMDPDTDTAGAKAVRARRKRVSRPDHEIIVEIFPGVRAVGVMPM